MSDWRFLGVLPPSPARQTWERLWDAIAQQGNSLRQREVAKILDERDMQKAWPRLEALSQLGYLIVEEPGTPPRAGLPDSYVYGKPLKYRLRRCAAAGCREPIPVLGCPECTYGFCPAHHSCPDWMSTRFRHQRV